MLQVKDYTPDYQIRGFDLKLKKLEKDGSFEGYASIFGNVDTYNEKVMPGAFQESLAKHMRKGTMPLMLWQHDPYSPIGVWKDLAEDGKGLRCLGQLLKGVRQADEAYIMLKADALQGLSIGYREVEADQENGVRMLKKLDLMEISVVSFAANERARITDIKSKTRLAEFAKRLRDGEPPKISEFEDILRDAGIPKSMAVKIASCGYANAIRSDSDGKADAIDYAVLKSAVMAFETLTKGN